MLSIGHGELTRFDPGEPRDDRGRWTDGTSTGTVSFISPNVGNLTFDEAVSALDGDRQKKITAASKEIDKALGIESTNYPAIGAWADGAENSMMVLAPGATTAQMRAASAMKGYVSDQKAVLVFAPSHDGTDYLASFDVEGKAADIHETLLKGGLAFHTLQPVGADRYRIHVFGSDDETIAAIDKATEAYGVIPEFVTGSGEFIGTTKQDGTDREQRDDARRQYERVIHEIAVSGAVEGQDIGATWNAIRDRWSQSEARAGQSEHPGPGYSATARVIDGVIHTSNVYDAQLALSQNRKVDLKQLKQVSTLIKRLGETAAEMAEAGETAPTFNLCNVSVAGTNVFCAGNKGIPRVEMPVIPAKRTKEFIKYLKDRGYKVEKGKEEARNLRATQNEISGAKVAASMARIKEEGFYKRLVISRDDYIVDGHHTWAGQLGLDAKDGNLEDDDRSVKIARVDIPILKLVEEAEKFTGGKGKKPASEAPKGFAQLTMRQASIVLPPALFKRYYGAACEFFAANAHLTPPDFGELVAVVRSAPLYVRRDLQNVETFRAWASAHGFDEVNDDLHVTVLYSKTPVDWDDLGNVDTSRLVVPAGGERSLEVLGDQGAVVLVFASTALARRHGEMTGDGASHDFDAYVPHVTINSQGFIPDGAVPYDGELVFGPEIFEQIEDETKDFDPSKHPRVPAGSPEGGQFGSGGGSSTSTADEADVKLDPKVVEVGGDEWNRQVARKLEREYQLAKPALEKITNNAVKESADAGAGWKSLSEQDRVDAFNAWRKEQKIDDYDEAIEKWDAIPDEEKIKIAVDHGVVAAEALLKPKDTWDSLSAEQQDTAYWQWFDKNKDNYETGATAKEAWDKLSDEEKVEFALHDPYESDEDEDDTPIIPEEWDMLTYDQQNETEEKWKKNNYDSYHQSEVDNWYDNGSALDDAKNAVAWDYTKNLDSDGREWAVDAMEEWRASYDDAEKPLPFSTDQLLANISITYSGNGEGSEDPDIEFDDAGLDAQGNFDPDQMNMPGIEPQKPSDRLTEDMRQEIIADLTKAFNKKADDRQSDMEPPDYLSESVDEYLDSSWGEMTDKQKFEYAEEYEIFEVPDSESKDPTISANVDPYKVEALPSKYDPLNETTGTDYQRTQRLARYLSIMRAREVIKERTGLSATKQRVAEIDSALWSAWKGSSTSEFGILLQVATAEELGGRLNPKTATGIDVDASKELAERRYKDIGGYKGVLAYLRAKWETSQYLLDKAGQHELALYRGLDLARTKKDEFDAAMKEKMARAKQMVTYNPDPSYASDEKFTKLPTVRVDRNGAASTTTDIGVANGWAGAREGKITLRAVVPRTAAISIPAYGINVHGEHEVVVAGTAWKGWDAWAGKAPSLDKIPIGPKGSGIGTNAPVQSA